MLAPTAPPSRETDPSTVAERLETAAALSRQDVEDIHERLGLAIADLQGHNQEIDAVEALYASDGTEGRAAAIVERVASDLERTATRLRRAVNAVSEELER